MVRGNYVVNKKTLLTNKTSLLMAMALINRVRDANIGMGLSDKCFYIAPSSQSHRT